MTPYVLSCVPQADVELLGKICLVVEAFPDGLGYFRPHYNHSWLKTPNRHIIDVYPVGILGGPFLVEQTMSFMSPGRHLYQPDEKTWHMVAKPDVQRAIKLATEVALRVVQNLGVKFA